MNNFTSSFSIIILHLLKEFQLFNIIVEFQLFKMNIKHQNAENYYKNCRTSIIHSYHRSWKSEVYLDRKEVI